MPRPGDGAGGRGRQACRPRIRPTAAGWGRATRASGGSSGRFVRISDTGDEGSRGWRRHGGGTAAARCLLVGAA